VLRARVRRAATRSGIELLDEHSPLKHFMHKFDTWSSHAGNRARESRHGSRVPSEHTISEIESSSRRVRQPRVLRLALVTPRADGDLCLLGVGRIVAFVMDSGFEGAPPVNAARLKAVRTDVASLTEYEAHLSGKVQFLLDATLGLINIEQNEIVKTLTIASVVGIPPVLVAGIYGMNFRVIPELNWRLGYPMAIALIVISALLPLLWFKRRGWM
jgi:magnesium transporter